MRGPKEGHNAALKGRGARPHANDVAPDEEGRGEQVPASRGGNGEAVARVKVGRRRHLRGERGEAAGELTLTALER